MVDLNAALGHNFLKIAIGNRITNIKEYGIKDDAFGEMDTFEIDCHPLPPHSITDTDWGIAWQE